MEQLYGYVDILMKNEFVVSSSGPHLFINFNIGSHETQKGFSANIHYGMCIYLENKVLL